MSHGTVIYLDAVNKVLLRLREAEVTTVSETPYSKLIGELVNQSYREVMQAWQWSTLYAKSSFSTVQSTDTYTLSESGTRSTIRFVFNTTQASELIPADRFWIQRQASVGPAIEGCPQYYSIQGWDLGDTQIRLYPVPDGIYALDVVGTEGPFDLTSDGNNIRVPPDPVVLGAYLLAVAERGDDRGVAEARAQADYQVALGDAIANDNNNQEQGRQTDWRIE